MERREFLKRAGVGTAVLASFPALADVAWADDGDDEGGDRRGFIFQALSGQAATLGGGETIAMGGCGSFRDSRARGEGVFVHFDGKNLGTPNNVIATGTWRARRVLSWKEIGTWGVAVAGILELAIELRPCGRRPVAATLKIVCNLGPAGIVNSPFQQEGFTLTVPGLTPFAAFTPNIGLTLFTRDCPGDEGEDEGDDD